MLLEQFLHETRYLSIAHLYFDEEKLTILSRAKKEHTSFQSFDLAKDLKTIPMADILFIEIGESSKDKLKLLVSLFAKHKPIIAYIFADDVENRLLLKFALHFGITDVLPLKNEENLLFSIFSKNANKLDDKLYTFQKIELEKKIEHFFPFLVFQGETLTYANAKAKMLYETNDLTALQAKLNRDEELCEALKGDEDAQGSIVIETASADKEVYLCIIKSFPQSSEKIVTLINYDPESETKNCSSILNRFDFVDKLKDRLAQQSVTQAPISLVFINISNLDKLSKTFTSTTLYDAFKNLMLKLFQLKEENQDVIQWSPNLYILMGEERSFEHACEQTKHLQQELIRATINEKITPIILTSAFHVESDDLNVVIDYIEKINTKTLLPHDIEKIKYFELEYLDNVIEEQEQIAYLMHNCVNNKIPIKLLNIYKGLCINTISFIQKMAEDSYQMSCENLQGYAMQIEKETVLQAPNFPKDIKAEVSLVDIKRSFVVIRNLSFMPSSANSRQHTRVQTSIRTPVLIKYAQRSSAQGDILDISVTSIAMKVGKSFREEEMLNQKVRLNFSLPNEEGENGYVIMDIEAKVTYISQKDDATKIVVLLGNLPKPYDDYLLRYMYNRQKELIFEIKKATKAYN
ncbi:PilZ domain-containing protein [Sulfurospirillum multivorans]|uniref:PilZ domain-containing protein n=2 Tax=Sulfurospirillum multivorans TaxID=66821 RepID=A0AA86DY83_SULMK|nr:PilZ domain-containing protein [Sulfurospirillum multivorans]AHJ12923.1 PilZ domain-containing protein [Sulfurospirillum multivorans DSM 12446]QEH06413.1 PilZ domain-containing protein [Sulfurospirillum multivorans]